MALGSLGTVAYDIVAKDKTAVGLDSAGARARQIGKVAGAAMTGVGVGMIALTDSSKKTNAVIMQTSLQLGTSAEEMRELTLATANVTFPIEEVTASFDLLTRAGMTNKDEIATTATAFDTLGDAIGMNASEVTDIMIPAFNAFGLELADAGDYTDIFTHLSRNTTVELADFSSMVNYLAADLGTMDLTMQDSVAVMEALADKGIKGSAATREFRTAVSGADGDVDLFYDALGLTKDEVGEYSDKISDSTGITDDFAEAANTQYGVMDDVKHGLSELTLKYGSMLEPLDAMGPAMSAMGPIMMAASSMNFGMVTPLLAHAGAAWASIAPYLAIILPIIAVIAIFYILEKKFGVVTKIVEIAKETFGKLVDFLKGGFTDKVEGVKNLIGMFGDKLLIFLGPIGLVIYAFKNWEEILGIVTGVFNSIMSYIAGLYSKFRDAGANIVQSLIDGIKSLINKPAELIKDALGSISDMLPFSPAKKGPLAKLPDWESYLVEPIEAVKISPKTLFSPEGGTVGSAPTGGNIDNTITIGTVNLSRDYDFDALMRDIEVYQRDKRVQRGI